MESLTLLNWSDQPISPWVYNSINYNNERLKKTPHTGLVLEEEGGSGGKKTNALQGLWVEKQGKWYNQPIKPTSLSPWVCNNSNNNNNKRLKKTPHTGLVLEGKGGRRGKKTNALQGWPWVEKQGKWYNQPIKPTSFSPWVCNNSNNNNKNNKRLKTTPHTGLVLEEEDGGGGRWDEMPRDVLIKIFNLLPFQHALHHSGFAPVCKSWLYAAVDIVYPPSTTVIDLRFLATIPFDKNLRLRYMVYLKVLLDTRPHTQWTTLYLPDKIVFSKDDFTYIAQRTPCLQYLDWPCCGHFLFDEHWKAISSWKNLKGIDLGASLGGNDRLKSWMRCFACFFKNLRSLRLVGRFGVEDVSVIIQTLFPQLEHFSLRDSSLTMDAASLVVSEVVATNNINNSPRQVGIQTLDLRHCAFISIRSGYMDLVVKQRLVEVEIHEKAAAAIKTYLRCEGLELCSQCKVIHDSLWHFLYRGGGSKLVFPRISSSLNNRKRGSSSWNK